ncbi:putative protein tyrosine phosphatase [Pseudomonas nitritireducens]|uniref:Tyrosine specific protein phosphatases domain-containing protein n=1 Tax=Pseudomonas nitroreducens TaxID=46680 RepID=A0A7W7KFH1_PSENT|nr:dual specificity protein phosphatase family protein [Pseudomonas nitritireducens]MBB4861466.1 putative protein tyrosine phosphatase [Pseudomonas nitritireducens]
MAKTVAFLPQLAAQKITTPVNMIAICRPGDWIGAYLANHPRYLRLEFDDVDSPQEGTTPFSPGLAQQILEFLQEVGDESVIVHCQAGYSRSCAVAKFMVDNLGYTLDLHRPGATGTAIHFNRLVYQTLMDVSGRSMRSFYLNLQDSASHEGGLG